MISSRTFVGSFVLLWVFEGLLRRFIPILDFPLYVFRDVLTLAFVLVGVKSQSLRAYRNDLLLLLGYTLLIIASTIVAAICFSIQPVILVSGMKSMLSPALGLFALLSLVPRRDLDYGLRLIVQTSPVVLAVSLAQVASSPTARINAVGDEGRAEFVNFEVVRATGTFSAPSGLTLYVVLLSALSMWLLASQPHTRLGTVGLFSALTLTAVGGSRGAVLGVAIVVATVMMFSTNLKSFRRPVFYVMILGAVAYILAMFRFPGVLESFIRRFETASRTEDTSGRILDQIFGALVDFDSIWGAGIGSFGNVSRGYGPSNEWVEADPARWVAELGFLGLLLAVAKLLVGLGSLNELLVNARSPDRLLSLSVAVPTLLYGQLTQNPTVQGAAALIMAWAVASRRKEAGEAESGGLPRHKASLPRASPGE